ncbi:SUMF1/EgtB/PvdO family nonheme iron enzyme [Roseiconus nitratireducens]|uniref:SUMF1/EgtB/PvdO family nonheme iron enzyme n=1 Tax=Roseiconus nitratireducens TaxID=2605748 RepID=A0A5M6D075_9BACT|nr:SUMF1/EgtB/PvdO family nonheme iron enzyme [Roseiconus nitratireducens]KAA5540743.1 SUMF1/EgtB/PvdO family nonheme iron enzyme [Roseiconus nitratireducens]
MSMDDNDETRFNSAGYLDGSVTRSSDGSQPYGMRGLGEAPETIGRYRIERQLGEGGFGVVYLAFDERLNRRVALKVPHADLVARPHAAEVYLREARTVANLEHPNIVPVYDFGTTEDYPCFIVMKYIEGMDLRTRISRTPLGFHQSATLIAKVAEALHTAHKQGVVHRDLKPGNILIDGRDEPCVVDFGLALSEQDAVKGPCYAGTYAYMSPEQARGEGHRVDGRSDIYNLGGVLYELLTGRKTVSATSKAEILEQVKLQEVKPPRQINDAVPRELERICLRALAKRASERYTTAMDMAQDLRHFVSEASTPSGSIAGEPGSGRLSTGGSASEATWAADSAVTSGPHASDTSRNAITVETSPSERSDSQCGNVIPKGLRSFESHDADFFLRLLPGPRDRQGLPETVRFWKHRLDVSGDEPSFPVGLIYGPSGCGKSSLVKAGILPRLSPNVVSVVVEATPGQTESDLLSALLQRVGDDGHPRRLPETVAAIRRGELAGGVPKVLIVLDQFEQWLHAAKRLEHSELTAALRQCDGNHVQCLLLVRDDFWLPISRFFRALEIPLAEGHNSGMVDLFDHDHAKRVLAAFGRAYGKLPEPAEISSEQDRFLELAIAELIDEGKVISVRLALFAEMMKSRSWTPASLETLGGTTGLGAAFLEQTFESSNAPPEYRFHQPAACALLKALLPEAGVDIKGEMKSYSELKQRSGYQDRPQDFERLIRMLDGEVRLIAPTDPASSIDPATAETPAENLASRHESSQAYYQLTHDYLVPSLRKWLTRKQQATFRGRTEIRLAERTALWKSRQENRLLPAWWEWLRFRLLTRPGDWNDAQTLMMRRTDRYFSSRGLMLAAGVAALLWAGWQWNGHRQSARLVNSLAHAPTSEVPSLVDQMSDYQRWVSPALHNQLSDLAVTGDDRRELHVRLALLPTEPGQADWLFERALRSKPEELRVIRSRLDQHRDRLLPQMWEVLQRDTSFDRRLRAACLLAAFAPQDERWKAVAEDVLTEMTAENPLEIKEWVALLRPAGANLLPAVAGLIAENVQPAELKTLAEVYAEFVGETPDGFASLESRLQPPNADSTVSDQPGEEQGAPSLDPRQTANVAAALAIAGEWSDIWPLLSGGPDPTLRSHLIANLGANAVAPSSLADHLDPGLEPDASVRQAIALVLGDLPDDRRSKTLKSRLTPRLQQFHRGEPSEGARQAIAWTLRRWDADVATDAKPDWPQMVAVPSGQLDVPAADGATRSLVIAQPFEISATEVTFTQFRHYRKDQACDRRAAPTAECPVHEVTWYDAAAFCNWLSERDKVPQDQWCYLPNADGDYGQGMKIRRNALQLSGYRLPTVEEWEFACRAGTTTTWALGNSEQLLDRYAWSLRNSGIHSRSVARLRPNLWGLFDMHGNVWEWCHDRRSEDGQPVGAWEEQEIQNHHHFALRGGTYLTDPVFLGSSAENWNPAGHHTNADGFRVARTLQP